MKLNTKSLYNKRRNKFKYAIIIMYNLGKINKLLVIKREN